MSELLDEAKQEVNELMNQETMDMISLPVSSEGAMKAANHLLVDTLQQRQTLSGMCYDLDAQIRTLKMELKQKADLCALTIAESSMERARLENVKKDLTDENAKLREDLAKEKDRVTHLYGILDNNMKQRADFVFQNVGE